MAGEEHTAQLLSKCVLMAPGSSIFGRKGLEDWPHPFPLAYTWKEAHTVSVWTPMDPLLLQGCSNQDLHTVFAL